jgi:nifR3 family TIM-barrel protein
MSVRDLLKKNRLVGAPLAGVTNYPFRKLVRKFHDGLIFTEMVSVEGAKRGNKQTLKLIDIKNDESPIGIQLFGGNPESFPEAVRKIEDSFDFYCFDINMGCPVKKVLRSKAGAYLLTDLDTAKKIISNVRSATKKPLFVKTRIGWDDKSLVYKELLKICESEGVDLLTIHGRTKSQLYSGYIHYDIISEIKSMAKIPVVGNGDVVDMKSFDRMLSTGVDGVMIGRGMMKSPWIFKALNEGRNPLGYLSGNDIKELLFYLLDEEKKYRENKYFIAPFKKYAVWFSKGFSNSADFRVKVYSSDDEEYLRLIIDDFYSGEKTCS